MKMKKNIVLFSMLAVLLALTACSSGTKEVSFDYTERDIIYSTAYQAYQIDNIDEPYRLYLEDSKESNPMAEILLTGISNFDSARSDCGEFLGYRSTDGDLISFDFERMNSTQSDEDVDAITKDLESFLANVKSSVEETSSGDVIVTLTAAYEKRDAEYSFVYEENPEAAYSYQISGQNASPYKIKEITVTPDYSTSEIMGKAGANTLMGMGTVFIVLIFISLIIGQFEKVGKLANSISTKWANKGINEEETSSETFSKSSGAAVSSSQTAAVDDKELIAVITAAVVAANVAGGGSDKLIVRSIRKARR